MKGTKEEYIDDQHECVYFTRQEANDLRLLVGKTESLLKLIEHHERTNWLVNTAKFWALWMSAILLAVTGGWEAVKNILRKLIA